MHPSVSLVSVKSQSWKMLVGKLQSQLLTAPQLWMHTQFFNEPPWWWHRCVPADLRKGLALSIVNFVAAVWTRCLCSNRRLTVCSCLYVSAVFVLSLLSMPVCCLNRFVERTSRWYWTGFKFERTYLILWLHLCSATVLYFLFQTLREHSFVFRKRIQNVNLIHSCGLCGVFSERDWLTYVTMAGWFSDS